MLIKEELEKLYKSGLSMQEISAKTGSSYHQVTYWMDKYGIPRRSLSEAIYTKQNPDGNPFEIKELQDRKDFELFNLGVGLFLGEGTKRDKFSIRFTNSDPKIMKLFLRFLREICKVKETKIKAWLNVFDDIKTAEATDFWVKITGIPISRFDKTIIRKNKVGNYKNKSLHGTLTIYVSNKKLKNLMDGWCERTLSCCT